MRNTFSKIIIALAVFGGLALVQADTIKLQNGDQLTGQLTAVKGEKILLNTPYATNPIAVSADDIKDASFEGKYSFRMSNDDKISGHINTIREGSLVIQAKYLDKLLLPLKEIASVRTGQESTTDKTKETVSSETGSKEEQDKEETEEKVETDTDDTADSADDTEEVESLWEGSISAGGNRQRGNTERTSATVEINAERATEQDEMSLLFRYNYAEEDSELTTRNIYGEMEYDYNLSERWYWSLNSSFLSDEFRDLDLRTTVGLGIGYRWLKSPRFSLATEAGLTYISRNYETSPDETDLAGRLSADFDGQITDTLSVFEELTVYPSLEGGSHLVHNEMGLKSKITDAWHLKLSHITDYNSDPPAGIEDTDTTLSLSVGYSF